MLQNSYTYKIFHRTSLSGTSGQCLRRTAVRATAAVQSASAHYVEAQSEDAVPKFFVEAVLNMVNQVQNT